MWAIHGSIANQGDSQIESFATQISTNAGQNVPFKIDTASSGYTLDIYRLGYYGGNGARLITTMHHSRGTNQPAPIFNSATNTVDAGNWSVTDSRTIPSTAVSGVYFAKLTTDSGNFQNMTPFIVRNDGTPRTFCSRPATRPGKHIIPGADIICIKVPVVRTVIVPMRSAIIA